MKSKKNPIKTSTKKVKNTSKPATKKPETAVYADVSSKSLTLTENEWQSFITKSLSIMEREKNQLISSLQLVRNTPTGAMEIKEMLNSNRSIIAIVDKDSDEYLKEWGQIGSCFAPGKVAISTKLFQNKAHAGQVAMHEFLHGFSPFDEQYGNKILSDAEALALHRQLATEMSLNVSIDNFDKSNYNIDISYMRSYHKNLKDLQDAAKNISNLKTDKEKDDWAKKQASLKTRAEFIRDFIAAPENSDTSLSIPSYSNTLERNMYKLQNEAIAKHGKECADKGEEYKKLIINQQEIDCLVKKYTPYLKQSDFDYLKAENEAINKAAFEGKIIQEPISLPNTYNDAIRSIDSYLKQSGKTASPIGEMLPSIRKKLQRGKDLTDEENIIANYIITRENKTMSLRKKRQEYDTFISDHQRLKINDPSRLDETYPVRTQMIEESNEELNLNRKIVQNKEQQTIGSESKTSGLCATLNNNSGKCLTNDSTQEVLNQLPLQKNNGHAFDIIKKNKE